MEVIKDTVPILRREGGNKQILYYFLLILGLILLAYVVSMNILTIANLLYLII